MSKQVKSERRHWGGWKETQFLKGTFWINEKLFMQHCTGHHDWRPWNWEVKLTIQQHEQSGMLLVFVWVTPVWKTSAINSKMDMLGPWRPRTASNVCRTLTVSCPAKIFCVILNKTEDDKMVACLFLCAIIYPCRTPLSTILGWGLRGPQTILNAHPT